MQVDTEGVVCGLTTHGEHGGVVRFLSPEHGMVAAYIRGARGRRMRPVLIPGNVVAVQLRWRNESQLPQAIMELAHSRAPLLSEPLPAAAIEWATALVAAALPERQPYPRVYQ
nr:recombination protein O N-terminal domain-containing protein [Sphingomonas sp.]